MKESELPRSVARLETTILQMGGFLAFSQRSREEIRQRAGGVSEISGDGPHNGHFMHAAHINHDRRNPNYDDPRNGRFVTVTEHYEQHVNAVGRAREIGLSEQGNQYAINKLSVTPARKK